MKFLIIGAGSIGSRHARNLKALGHQAVLADPDPARGQYADYRVALEKEKIDAVVIASPSNLHVEAAQYVAGKGIPIFMEKPLATSLDGLDELVRTIDEKKLITMMGQSYRWHEGLLALKAHLEGGELGKVLRAEHACKEYLPAWHPDRDYRQEYAAQKRMGGGALFTSMSHTLDFIEWLFGTIVDLSGKKERLGDLEMDADDTATVSGKTERDIAFDAHNDFITQPPVYTLHVVGERGEAHLDLITNTLDGVPYPFEPNYRYVEELKHFIDMVQTKTEDVSLDLAHGAHLVALMCDSKIKDLT